VRQYWGREMGKKREMRLGVGKDELKVKK